MSINTKEQINNNITTISTLLENIQSNIKFKANDNNFNQITKTDNQIIKDFIIKLGKFDKIVDEENSPTKLIMGNKSDNNRLYNIYEKITKEIKFKPNIYFDRFFRFEIINKKKIFFNYLNYKNLSSKIVNFYLTSMIGRLVSLNMCFKLSEIFSKKELINKNIILDTLKEFFNISDYNIVTEFYLKEGYYFSNNLKIPDKINVNYDNINDQGTITIKLQTDNLYQTTITNPTNFLTFYLVIDYLFVESSETIKNCENINKINSTFRMNFNIQDEHKNNILSGIKFGINYYNCEQSKNIFYNNKFFITINNKQFYIYFNLKEKILDKLDKFIV